MGLPRVLMVRLHSISNKTTSRLNGATTFYFYGTTYGDHTRLLVLAFLMRLHAPPNWTRVITTLVTTLDFNLDQPDSLPICVTLG